LMKTRDKTWSASEFQVAAAEWRVSSWQYAINPRQVCKSRCTGLKTSNEGFCSVAGYCSKWFKWRDAFNDRLRIILTYLIGMGGMMGVHNVRLAYQLWERSLACTVCRDKERGRNWCLIRTYCGQNMMVSDRCW
jgi:hypothetical protein